MKARRVLVLNHNAVPLGEGGLTRNADMFSRLTGWSHLIVNARTTQGSQRKNPAHSGFTSVYATQYSNNGLDRVLNWLTYTASAYVRGAIGAKPDVVYVSSPHPLAGAAGVALARQYHVPFVLEVRDLWPEVLAAMGRTSPSSLSYRSLEFLIRHLYDSAVAIVVLSEGVHEYLSSRVDPKKLVLIPNSVDLQLPLSDVERHRIRVKQGWKSKIAVYGGAHGPANGLDAVLDAARDRVGDGWLFVMVGEGVEKERLQGRARAEGLRNVQFLPTLPKHEFYQLLAACDLGLHVLADVDLFAFGISPNKLLDYWAVGLPVITNVGGHTGSLVRSIDGGLAVGGASLASGIGELSRLSEADLRAMGSRGQNWVRAERSRSEMVGRLQSLLDSLVSGR